MPDMVQQNLVLLTHWLEIAGAVFMVFGFVVTSVRYLAIRFGQGADAAIGYYRQALGRVVIIGLEVLVGATIVKTITIEQDMESLNLLAIMIVIRTFLGWTTVLETNGRWPWQSTP